MTLHETLGLREVPGTVDLGLEDPHNVGVSVTITPGYDAWLKSRGGEDVKIMLPSPSGGGAWSSSGPAKHGVQLLINMATHLVENLIDAGVPDEVAAQLLPKELYDQWQARRR